MVLIPASRSLTTAASSVGSYGISRKIKSLPRRAASSRICATMSTTNDTVRPAALPDPFQRRAAGTRKRLRTNSSMSVLAAGRASQRPRPAKSFARPPRRREDSHNQLREGSFVEFRADRFSDDHARGFFLNRGSSKNCRWRRRHRKKPRNRIALQHLGDRILLIVRGAAMLELPSITMS